MTIVWPGRGSGVSIGLLAPAVLVMGVWFGVDLSAQQPGQGSLRASVEREATRLASTLVAKDRPTKGSVAFAISSAQTERIDDWGAVQRLKPGSRVRVTPRQGLAVTGKVTAVNEEVVSMDRAAFWRDEVYEVRLSHGLNGLGVAGYTGLGALAGGVTGYIAGSASADCHGCGEQGLAAFFGAIGGSFLGGMSGFIVGEVAHHLPERLVYRRPES